MSYESAEAEQDLRWAVVVQGQPFGFLLAAREVEWTNLLIQMNINVSGEHEELFASLDEDFRDAFLFDLRIALASSPVGQRIELDDSGNPERFMLALNILEDPLSRAGFLRRVSQIQSTAIVGTQMFQKLSRFRRWPV